MRICPFYFGSGPFVNAFLCELSMHDFPLLTDYWGHEVGAVLFGVSLIPCLVLGLRETGIDDLVVFYSLQLNFFDCSVHFYHGSGHTLCFIPF